MKAIILAAGEGKRLRPHTLDRPKCMVAYKGRPLITYQINAFRANKITDIVVVCGYRAEAIDIKGVRFVSNTAYERTNMVYSLFCAEHELNDDVIVSYGDILFEERVLRTLITSTADFAIAVDLLWRSLWQARMENPLEDAETLKLDDGGYIVELGKKPKSFGEIQGQYMGLFMIRRAVLPKVIEHYHHMDRSRLYDGRSFDQMFMTSFLQDLIEHGIRLKAVPVRGGWLEIDREADLYLSPISDASTL